MKIYKLVINKIADEPNMVVSSYILPRNKQYEVYYLTKELAQARQNEIYDGLQKLLGFIPKVEAIIEEIEVKEV